MLKVDLHMHSNYIQKKDEGECSPKEIIDHYSKEGFDAIAITEHASVLFNKRLIFFKYALKTYNDFKEYAKKKGLLLIPGIEIFIEGKEVIILNYNGNFTKLKTFEDLRKLKKKERNILILAPHPFYGLAQCLKEKLEKNIDIFDAIEHTHVYFKFFNKPNKKAIAIAKKYNKPLIANSDAHKRFQVYLHNNYSLVDSKKNANSIIKAIKQKKVKIKTEPVPFYKIPAMLGIAIIFVIRKHIQKTYS